MRTEKGNERVEVESKDSHRETNRTLTEEERRAFLERLNEMDRGEYAAFIRDATVEKVREMLIVPLVDAMLAEQKRMDVVLTSLKYMDFWNYREQMIEIIEKNPGIVAEQVYRMAKDESLLNGN